MSFLKTGDPLSNGSPIIKPKNQMKTRINLSIYYRYIRICWWFWIFRML